MFHHIQFLLNVFIIAMIWLMVFAFAGDSTAMQLCIDFGKWLTQKGCENGAFEGIDSIRQCGIKL